MKWMKWLKRSVAGVAVLVVAALAVVYGVSSYRMSRKFQVDPPGVEVPKDPASLAEGRRLFVSRGCADCHGDNGGGKVVIDDFISMRLAGSNLTPGKAGAGARYTDLDLVRAIRHAVAPDGRALLFMPAHEYHGFSDMDVGCLIAYIRTLAPVDPPAPSMRPGPLVRLLYLVGEVPLVPAELIDHRAPRPAAVAVGTTVEYGRYLGNLCSGCHGEAYAGGPIPGAPPDWPPARNLTPHASGLAGWSAADFARAMREGKRKDGSPINPIMPWPNFRSMTDTELQALWAYLQTVPPKAYGER